MASYLPDPSGDYTASKTIPAFRGRQFDAQSHLFQAPSLVPSPRLTREIEVDVSKGCRLRSAKPKRNFKVSRVLNVAEVRQPPRDANALARLEIIFGACCLALMHRDALLKLHKRLGIHQLIQSIHYSGSTCAELSRVVPRSTIAAPRMSHRNLTMEQTYPQPQCGISLAGATNNMDWLSTNVPNCFSYGVPAWVLR